MVALKASLLAILIGSALGSNAAQLASPPGKMVEQGRPTLTGIVSVHDPTVSYDLAFLEWSSPPPAKRLLRPGERERQYELVSIAPQSGKVVLREANKEQFELTLADPLLTPPKPVSVLLRNADLFSVFDLYQNLSGRTILRPNTVPNSRLTITIEAGTQLEAAIQLESFFNTQDLVLRHRADKFCLIIPTARSKALESIPELPRMPVRNLHEEEVIFPPGLIKFQDADIMNVLHTYQDLTERIIIRPKLRPEKITIKTQTELSRGQAIWALDTLLHLSGVEMVPETNKFVFAVPPEQTNNLLHFDRKAALAAVNSAAPPLTSAEKQLSDTFRKVVKPSFTVTTDADAQTLLNTYASVTGRQAQPLASTLPGIRFSLQPRVVPGQSTFDQAEVIYLLQALAFVNGAQFENIGSTECRLVSLPQ